jgi:two-component system phosphate regulon sensor histidine kinase PhoR
MKFTHPFSLLAGGAFVLTFGYVVGYVVVSIAVFHSFNIPLFLISSLFIFLLAFITFSYILKKYIYEKIKPIYKTILKLKQPKGVKVRNVDFNHDILQKVNEDVANWAEQHSNEMAELKRLEIYRREFLGNVSHELKTPIFNIQGYVLTLLDGAIDEPVVNREYLLKSEKNVDRIINIINDLSVISQLESGEALLKYSRFDLIELTREIFDILETKANQHHIRLVFNAKINDDSRLYVSADKEKIRQVLTNLIENSIKYGKENGRTKVSFYDMDEIILIEVSDNGIGIETAHISRLFERFYRVDKSRSRNIGGSGLGLSIVKHIIESHNQTINVRSAPGVGSTFSFTLSKG